jgi:protein TonB
VETTPKVSARIGNLGAPLERRLRVRQRLDDIIYLDIGADNGGIVLNLSEEGLRFQAVGPLDKQTELRLRIKIPGSKTRIDVIAQIAWLSDSKRQAGVRFLDVPSKGPAQIQEWIRSQLSPSSPLKESSKQVEGLSESQRKQETIRELPTDNGHNVIPEFGLSQLSRQEPPEISSVETRHGVPAARKDPVSYQKPEPVSTPNAEPAPSPSVLRPALREKSMQAAAVPIAREAAVISEKPEFVAPAIAELAESPSVARPELREESLPAAAVPTDREAAVIPEKLELLSEAIAEPAESPSVVRQSIQEEFTPPAAVLIKQKVDALISEKPEFVQEPTAKSARLPTVEPPALQEESLQSATVPFGREDTVIWENTELVSEPIAEPAQLPSVEPPALQEESLPVVAVPVARKDGVISEKPELVSEPIAEPAPTSSAGRPALQEESLVVAAVPVARKEAVISEKPELASEPIVESAPTPSAGRPAPQEESLPLVAVPTEREHAVISEKPEFVSEPIAEPANSSPEGPQATQEDLSHVGAVPTPGALARLELDAGDAPITAKSQEESRGESTLGWPVSVYRTVAMEMPRSPDAPRKPVERFVSAGNSKANSAPPVVNPEVAAPAATDRMLLWNQVAIAVLLTLCAILCFAIGTWVGQIVTRRNSPTAAVSPLNSAFAPVNVVPTAKPGVNGSTSNIRGSTGKLAPETAEKVRSAPSPALPAIESRKVVPSVSSPEVVPLPQNTPSIPPAEQNVTAVATTKQQESNPPAAPAPENITAAPPSPRIVAGLTLKPSDRFNPSHLSYRVQPAYPPEAQKQQIEGVVKIHQVIGTDGRVRNVSILSGPPLLVTAALEAARYWRYLPALLNGQPVETEQDVEIEFRLPY